MEFIKMEFLLKDFFIIIIIIFVIVIIINGILF